MPARNRASARELAVLNIELEIGPFPLEPNTRCALGKPTTAALPPLLFGVGKGTLWAGKANIWLSRDPRAHSGSRPELAPLGLDSGTRGYNPRCRDTVALPPPSSLEWAKARVEREKADIWLNQLAPRRGRRDPGRGWALRAFIKTPATLPHPSSPPAPGPGPGTVFRAAHFRRFL
jgi:hypothetical protein